MTEPMWIPQDDDDDPELSEHAAGEVEIHDPFQVPEQMEMDLLARPKRWYAYQMRVAGVSNDIIAEKLGYKNAAVAASEISRYRREFRESRKEEIQDLVELDLDRIDMLLLVTWKQARMGDLKAVHEAANLIALRMKLLGTEKKASEKPEATTTNMAFFIGGSEAEYRENLRRARLAAGIEQE